MVLEDRQSREKELSEERQRRDEELKRKEEELREEQARREEEAWEREEQMRQQFELLQGLVEGVQHQGEAGIVQEADPKVAKLSDKDDIEAYLTMFKRLMSAYSIPEDRWNFKLAPQLVRKAQQAYAAMNPDEAGNYEQLKAAILRRYGINEESYHQRFRQARKKQEESNKEFATLLQDLTN